MIITINESKAVLEDIENFSEFSVNANGHTTEEVDRVLRIDGAGHVTEKDAFITPSFLQTHALSGVARNDWVAQLNQMIDFARSKGWTNELDEIQAHIINASKPAYGDSTDIYAQGRDFHICPSMSTFSSQIPTSSHLDNRGSG